MPILSALVLVATPVLAFAGSLIGHRGSRVSAVELDRWRRREETMRMLRWASELAVDADQDRRRLGVTVLETSLESSMTVDDDVHLLDAVIDSVLNVRPRPAGPDSPPMSRWS